jgi:hypothetical protein
MENIRTKTFEIFFESISLAIALTPNPSPARGRGESRDASNFAS